MRLGLGWNENVNKKGGNVKFFLFIFAWAGGIEILKFSF